MKHWRVKLLAVLLTAFVFVLKAVVEEGATKQETKQGVEVNQYEE
tara:strand:+ start:933 stop:1067 length:135 start_codon:yes stop_codon:yes gene_type:complete